MEPVFTNDEVRRLEDSHPDGLSVQAVVELLRQRGVELAEATFRKYVQLGLLPRSRRVGRKGKHRGSHGLYPAACVGRIAEIRSLMDQGLTLEDIQRSSVAFASELEALRRAADGILDRLEEELTQRSGPKAPSVQRRLQALRTQADELSLGLEEATRELCPALPSAPAQEDPAEVAREAERVLRGRRPARPVAVAGRVGKPKSQSRADKAR